MKKQRNAIRITKLGVERIDKLMESDLVNPYHKTLLKAIKNNMPKNVSKSDCDVLNEISKVYPQIN